MLYMRVDRNFRVTIHDDRDDEELSGEPKMSMSQFEAEEQAENERRNDPSTLVQYILEGTCPKCESDLVVTLVGGSPAFYDEFYPETPLDERHLWEVNEDLPLIQQGIGGVSYMCHRDHEWYVERTIYGDWTI